MSAPGQRPTFDAALQEFALEGKETLSKADIAMTRKIQNAAKALRIELHDHLVIGHGRHVSFRAKGLL
jgi:DNA repair protein RadC